jgi:hypothetical protein
VYILLTYDRNKVTSFDILHNVKHNLFNILNFGSIVIYDNECLQTLPMIRDSFEQKNGKFEQKIISELELNLINT